IRDRNVTGVQTCALPICLASRLISVLVLSLCRPLVMSSSQLRVAMSVAIAWSGVVTVLLPRFRFPARLSEYVPLLRPILGGMRGRAIPACCPSWLLVLRAGGSAVCGCGG